MNDLVYETFFQFISFLKFNVNGHKAYAAILPHNCFESLIIDYRYNIFGII